MQILGIDIGGSGIKGAPVDTDTGELLAERIRIKTPKKAEPQPVADVVAEIARSFKWSVDQLALASPPRSKVDSP